MLFNVSYNKPKIKEEINKEVGKPFSFRERIKMRGIGSGKLFITETSPQIAKILNLDKYLNVCGIEMRPEGIIVTFRALLETYALVIPYYKLRLSKGKAEEYSISRDTYFIRVKANRKAVHLFMKKILNYKAAHSSSQQLP